MLSERNKYWKLGQRHGKIVGYSATHGTIPYCKGKSGSPEIIPEAHTKSKWRRPFDYSGIADQLSDFNTFRYGECWFWLGLRRMNEGKPEINRAQYHANRRRKRLMNLTQINNRLEETDRYFKTIQNEGWSGTWWICGSRTESTKQRWTFYLHNGTDLLERKKHYKKEKQNSQNAKKRLNKKRYIRRLLRLVLTSLRRWKPRYRNISIRTIAISWVFLESTLTMLLRTYRNGYRITKDQDNSRILRWPK